MGGETTRSLRCFIFRISGLSVTSREVFLQSGLEIHCPLVTVNVASHSTASQPIWPVSFVPLLRDLPMSDNPYQTDFSGSQHPNVSAGPMASEMDRVGEDLASLARWQAFFGFVGAVVCIIMTITVLFQVIFLLGVSGMGGVQAATSSGFLVLLLIVYGLPTAKLLKASQTARHCARQTESFSKMIAAQRSFWRTTGIIFSVFLGLYIALIVFALGLGVSAYNFF